MIAIPVTERLPEMIAPHRGYTEEGQSSFRVLAYDAAHGWIPARYLEVEVGGIWRAACTPYEEPAPELFYVTHWMPMPPAP